MSFDPAEALASIGIRAASASLRALIQEATKARLPGGHLFPGGGAPIDASQYVRTLK